MSNFVKAIKTFEIKESESVSVRVGNQFIAIANDKGKFFAVSDICPHAGAPLGGGWVEEGHIVCPHHYWKFNLTSGECPHIKDECIKTYNLKVEDDTIFIEIE